MRRLLGSWLGVALIAALIGGAPVPTLSAPAEEWARLVVGIWTEGYITAGGVPLSSGSWGTDYITVSHALSVRATYSIVRDGLPFAQSTPVTACSTQYHGIDVLILRVASHPRTPVVEWGDPTELKPGDELVVYPRREIQPDPSVLKFVHLNYLEWLQAKPTDVAPEWRNVMVADGVSKPGFSGSPWFRNGKVYGLHKGRSTRQNRTYALAETASKVASCLKVLGYESLVPTE